MRLLEIRQLSVLAAMLTPLTETLALKKSKILLSLTTFPVFDFAAVPRLITHFVGRLAPAGPMLLPITILLLFPPAAVDVLKITLPPAVATDEVDEPLMVQFARVSFEAPLMNRTVLVLAVADTVVLERVI